MDDKLTKETWEYRLLFVENGTAIAVGDESIEDGDVYVFDRNCDESWRKYKEFFTERINDMKSLVEGNPVKVTITVEETKRESK